MNASKKQRRRPKLKHSQKTSATVSHRTIRLPLTPSAHVPCGPQLSQVIVEVSVLVNWREVHNLRALFQRVTVFAHLVFRHTGVDHSLPINSHDGMEHCRRCSTTHPLTYQCRHQQLFFDFPPPIDQKITQTADGGLEFEIRPVMVIPTGHVYRDKLTMYDCTIKPLRCQNTALNRQETVHPQWFRQTRGTCLGKFFVGQACARGN